MYTKTYNVDNVEYIVFDRIIKGWKNIFFYPKNDGRKSKKLLLSDLGNTLNIFSNSLDNFVITKIKSLVENS